MWAMLAEDLPDESHTVTLSSEAVDEDGVPVPVVTYRVAEDTRRLLRFQVERGVQSLLEAGATQTRSVPLLPDNSHLLGTARMGDDPATSVVDRWSISHDIPNLVIADGSVFVTAGAVNPTSTIVALALRAADHLVDNRASVPVPTRRGAWGVGRPASPSPVDTQSEPPFSAAERAQLAVVGDRLIPPADDRPAPSAVGIGEQLLDQVLAARPDLASPLRRALTAGGDLAIRATDPAAADALELVVAGGYYLSPLVREAIGYPGQQARPVRVDGFPAYAEEGLLDAVLERRGPVHEPS